MNDQTLLCLAGGALLIWWITTGSKQTESLESDVENLESVAQWWQDNGLDAEGHTSYMAWNMDYFLQGTNEWRNLDKDEFANKTKGELMALATDLPSDLKIIYKMEKVQPRFLDEILRKGFQQDNMLRIPYERKDDMALFCKLGKRILQKTASIVNQVFQKLPGESTKTADALLRDFTAMVK